MVCFEYSESLIVSNAFGFVFALNQIFFNYLLGFRAIVRWPCTLSFHSFSFLLAERCNTICFEMKLLLANGHTTKGICMPMTVEKKQSDENCDPFSMSGFLVSKFTYLPLFCFVGFIKEFLLNLGSHHVDVDDVIMILDCNMCYIFYYAE